MQQTCCINVSPALCCFPCNCVASPATVCLPFLNGSRYMYAIQIYTCYAANLLYKCIPSIGSDLQDKLTQLQQLLSLCCCCTCSLPTLLCDRGSLQFCVNRMWLPPEENHEVTGFLRAVGGDRHWEERGAQLAPSKHMLHCVRQEHFIYTHVSVAWLCAKFPKGRAFTSGFSNKEVACVPSAVEGSVVDWSGWGQ